MPALKLVVNDIKAKECHGSPRSTEWPRVRAEHLKDHPECAACGSTANLEVHHVEPYHLHPEKELDPTNFITLCESDGDGVNCHLLFGHLGSYRSFNADVRTDAEAWKQKLLARPKPTTEE